MPGDRGLGAAAGRAQGKNVAPEAFVALKPVRVICLSLLGAPRAADARRIRGIEIRLLGPPQECVRTVPYRVDRLIHVSVRQ